ncbi:MAG: hypothetical protein J0G29_02375 [Alphaproteobacteria bacterium]|nr:hypothetical protein [Alphaproteobacteria bacterium]OJV45462.1 MAG: hypothetical protein BGO28_05035 [Alphaproteobacteria bacterium 43-37]
MIPRYQLPAATIQPVSAPADQGVVIKPSQTQAPNNKFGELAAALSKFNDPLQKMMLAKVDSENKGAFISGQELALNYQSWDEAVKAGRADVTDSPYFRKGFMEAKGRLAGLTYAQNLNQAYELWEGKNSIKFIEDPATGSKRIDQDSLLQFMEEVRKGYLSSHPEIRSSDNNPAGGDHAGGSPDYDWYEGFKPKMEMAEINLLNHHTAYTQAHLRESRLQILDGEVAAVIRQGLGGNDLKSKLDELIVEAMFTGLSKAHVEERVQNSVIVSALEMGGSHGDALLKVIDSDNPAGKQKILQAQKHIEDEMWRDEERAHHRKERQRNEFTRTFKSHVLRSLMDDPNYKPSHELEAQAIDAGVTDLPQVVELMRKQVLEYQVEHNVAGQERFYADLYAGRLSEQQILDSTFLNPTEKAQALKTHFAQSDIVKHEAVKSAKHILTDAIAPNKLESLLIGTTEKGQQLSSLAAEAQGEFHREIWTLQRVQPEIAGDPIALSQQATQIAQTLKTKYQKLKEQIVSGAPATNTSPNSSSANPQEKSPTSKLFQSKTELKQALADYKQGKGKLKDYVDTHPGMTQEQFESFLQSFTFED